MTIKPLYLSLFLLIPTLIRAQVRLPSLFTDNMVMQQQADCAVWGWAKAGSTITVAPSWAKQKYTAKADAAGKWKLKVSTPAASYTPYTLSVSGDGPAIQLKNVLIGEVWLCCGQSNMEMPLKGFKGQPVLGSNEAILHSKNDQLRLYTVPRSSVTEPQENSKASPWRLAEPEAVSNFSATAYYFGRLLQEQLHVPVGLLHCSYSGSFIEAWMDAENLRQFAGVKIPAKGDTIKLVSRTATTLYNGMLHPIEGYGIKGAIWYQGESNYDRPDEYAQLFTAMVKQWRTQWGMGDFPFYYAQIAPFDYTRTSKNKGGKYNSAFIRDTQRKLQDQVPNTAMAVLLDIGEETSIHPMRKEPGGTRLALLALAQTYGRKGFGALSPTYEAMTLKDKTIQLRFKNSPNGMTTFGQELTGFEIAGADQKWYPAKASINGSSITVSADAVAAPVAVRYAFQDFTRATLFSNEGLPVSSFRTDDWAQ
ncbi:sialate O-acetylesterase [Hymenobacter ginsengisoli]|uniref:Sialate O-acetylesterase n=1 Tax=Hymenobacter ginsengisoli TaxID=1051626 RepID=A0ABP8Q5Z0_9BACT|nr:MULTISPECIES: sialate O-acetylesterase [unclassified Hymenobacter]MBO2031665.1 sialate O-acetylesterase [Hymenobacter sp. BT559]